MGTLLRDLRYGLRLLVERPGFTLPAILTLAIGIGANTAVFSLFDTVLLRTLPVPEPQRLTLLRWSAGPNINIRSLDGSYTADPATGKRGSTSFSYPSFERLRDRAEGMMDVFGFAELYRLNVGVDGHAEIANGQVVSGNYYRALGVSAHLGRVLDKGDDQRAAGEPVAVLSHGYWQRRFGGDHDVLGKAIHLNGSPFTVVGITPRGFVGTLNVGHVPEITVPISFMDRVRPRAPDLVDAQSWWLQIMGRLAPGATPAGVQANLATAFRQEQTAGLQPGHGFDIPELRLAAGSRGLVEHRQRYSQTVWTLMGGVALILLIACANLANLLLARSSTRQREIAVRVALGASRARLVRQLTTESVMLSVLGGGAGLMLALWGKDLLLAALPVGFNRTQLDLVVDARVLLFTLGLSILTGIVFSLAPVLRATRVQAASALKEQAGGATGGRSWLGLGRVLVVGQVAMSMVLLATVGLFARTLVNLHGVDPGFDPQQVLLFRVDPTLNGYEDERLLQLYDRLVDGVRALPGVHSASLSMFPLVGGRSWRTSIEIDGREPQSDAPSRAFVQLVSPGFLDTMGIILLRGRALSPSDGGSAPRVAVINESMRREHFPKADPIGQSFRFDGEELPMEIVGVAQDSKYSSVRLSTPPTFFIPFRQRTQALGPMFFSVRSAGDPRALVPSLQETVRSVDPNLPMFEVRTQEEQIETSLLQERQFLRLSGTLGLVALVLVCVGLLGLLSYSVSRRTKEIGLRLALGAQRSSVLRLVVGQGMALVGIGLAAGLAAAYGLTRFLESLLFGVKPTDPLTFAGVALLLLGLAMLACFVPALRAARADPMVALRYE